MMLMIQKVAVENQISFKRNEPFLFLFHPHLINRALLLMVDLN